MANSPHVAVGDLSALSTEGAAGCLETFITALADDPNARITTSHMPLTPHGDGDGGAFYRFMLSPTSSIPVQLTADAYFYVQGRAEVTFLFVGGGQPFPNDSANQVIDKVMGRAKAANLT